MQNAAFQRIALRVTLTWFGMAMLLGLSLRVWAVLPEGAVPGLPFQARYVTHGHSHLMFLGWVFNALMLALTAAFVPALGERRHFRRLFWGMQVAVLGMLFTFPALGYKPLSIGFLTLHMALAFAWAWGFWKALKEQKGPAASAARWGLLFNAVSAIGPFALGYVSAKGLAATLWYPLSIYFYLHFQYNGWFVFGLLALWLSTRQEPLPQRDFAAMQGLAWAQFPAFLLSALWVHPPAWVWALAALGALLQMGAALRLAFLFGALFRGKVFKQKTAHLLLLLAAAAAALKIALQTLSVIPALAHYAYQERNVVIAYLHLVFIGLVTFFLLGWWLEQGVLQLEGRWARAGLQVAITGFVLIEGLLLWPGMGSEWLLVASAVMVGGFGWLGMKVKPR